MSDSQAARSPHPEPTNGVLDRALTLLEFLRANCPWDAAQTHASLRRYLLEEAHEVVDAIERADDEALRDELGDLLLNLAFQIVVAEERGAFDREAVVSGLEAKMKRRHPHLYGGLATSWERLKAEERRQQQGGHAHEEDTGRILDGLLVGLDPLAHAHRIQARVAEVGFDWPDAGGAWDKVREEVEEVGSELESGAAEKLEEEVGDLLFAVVNLARLSNVDPTLALQRANQKFTRRFDRVEKMALDAGMRMEEAGLEALDRLWNTVKREER